VSEFPRSNLFQTLKNHPVAAAATVAAVVFVGPARIARIGAHGLRVASRNAHHIAPVLQQLVRSRGR
jgi:hypothetical protein